MFTRKTSARKTSTFICMGLILISAWALAGCDGFNLVTAEESGSQTVAAPASPRVIVETFNGEIEVSASGDGKVEVNWVKRGSGDSQAEAEDDLNNVEVSVTTEGDTTRIVARRTDNRSANNSGASFRLSVPAASQLDLESSNGDIEISATQALVNADTSNGSIRFDGSLVDGDQVFRTSNGAIVVTLPADTRFRVSATTSNGEVTTDFPVTVSGPLTKGTLNGTAGENPGISLTLGSSNGSIEIRQSR